MDRLSFLSNSSPEFLESQYRSFLDNPNSVEESWRTFFDGFEFARKNYDTDGEIPENVYKEFKVLQLINGYRVRGHLFTQTNPVRDRRKYSPTLEIENFGLDDKDLETVFQAGSEVMLGPAKLKDIISHLETVYCQSIGAEFMYMRQPEKIDWMKNRLHTDSNLPQFTLDEKHRIYDLLNQSVTFENFLHTRFTGQKRFSIEGSEAIIPGLDMLIRHGAELGVQHMVMGMAHRGRLNVLANVFKKEFSEIMSEFEGKDYSDEHFDGDVKYHLGFSSNYEVNGNTVGMILCPNPSHLETVGPVAQGVARALIEKRYNGDDSKVLPIIIHGDAAIAGQGVVYEVIQMAQHKAYGTGGTIHIVINNQVGFTTNYLDGRSSTYCTDVGKVTLCPVFHVNGDDTEALVHTMKIAADFRQRYGQDVFIDLLSYRKYGHNEGDEPKFTQPTLYKAISKHPNPRVIYQEQLVSEGNLTAEEAKKKETIFKELLEQDLEVAKKKKEAGIPPSLGDFTESLERATEKDFDKSPDTGVSVKKLKAIAAQLTNTPKDKKLFRKMARILNDRAEMIKNDSLDWGMAELLAYGSLVDEGHAVRMSGQDVERGTFSHRHAIVKVEETGEEYCQLQHISKDQATFNIYNSILSEYAVLGFEYGYSLMTANSLTIWEAQFGDFVNGAQIVIDQYISSAEDKWNLMSGITMLLPHGYEGMGPEHSSARMERFLTLSGEMNMVVMNCTTPANLFHALRRQVKWPFRKPLIIFTPKSLLRHPRCVSKLEDLSKGGFTEVIDDSSVKPVEVQVVAFCQGKIYYELLAEREENGLKNIALVRVEQLYPLPQKQLDSVVKRYKNAKKHLWVQEEPENMGAWTHMLRTYRTIPLECISRPASASPASGSPARSNKRQRHIIEQVFSHAGKVTAS
ncbi:MAG: 2-oxoglutarate dehydrogenase E1 component [Flavobacteriales bacterium]|nr:2-oxoglutarate dehydrogenase E1 component [Flavobacteriales bacterium]